MGKLVGNLASKRYEEGEMKVIRCYGPSTLEVDLLV